jgi:hypothetical protein
MDLRRSRRLRLEELEQRWVPAHVTLGDVVADAAAAVKAAIHASAQAEAHASEHSHVVKADAKGKDEDGESSAHSSPSGSTSSQDRADDDGASTPSVAGQRPAVTPSTLPNGPVLIGGVTAPSSPTAINPADVRQAVGKAAFQQAADPAPALAAESTPSAAPAAQGVVGGSAAPAAASEQPSAAPQVVDWRVFTTAAGNTQAAQPASQVGVTGPGQQPTQAVVPGRAELTTLPGARAEALADEVFAQPDLVLPRSGAAAQERVVTPAEIAAGLVAGAGAGSFARVLTQYGSDLSGVATVLGEGGYAEVRLSPLAGLMISPLDRMLDWAADADQSSQEEGAENGPGWSWRSMMLAAGVTVGTVSAVGVGRRSRRRKPRLGRA